MTSPTPDAAKRRPENAQAYHNFLSGVYRLPFGAVETGTRVTLRVYVEEALSPVSVTLRVWTAGGEAFFPMRRCGPIWETGYTAPAEPQLVWYRFDIRLPDGLRYCRPENEAYHGGLCAVRDDYKSFQLTVYAAGFSVPGWAADCVMYQIFPDRFCRSEAADCETADRRLHQSWKEPMDYLPDPQKGYYAADDFFGGNLRGIEEKLPYLKKLGVTALYLNPIFKAASNHRYDTGDYEKIDPLLGTNEDFRRLCAAARAAGIRIVCDGVFSHTGSDSVYFNKNGAYPSCGACDSPDSPYYKWYRFKKYPDEYDCWWNIWSLPAVDETEPTYLDFITGKGGIAVRWLSAGAAGWRLDVADELPDAFLERFRTCVKAADENALIVGEVWEDASNKVSYGNLRRFLLGTQLDSVMNYPLRALILDLLTAKIGAADFCSWLALLASNYPPQAFTACMNFLSTHDVCRVTTDLGAERDVSALSREEQARFTLTPQQRGRALCLHRTAALLLFSLPGMPCVYYGDEIGLEGGTDPFNRAPFPWDEMDLPDRQALAEWYAALGRLRAAYPALRRGALRLCQRDGMLLIRRSAADAGAAELLSVVNPTDTPLPLPEECALPLLASCVLEARMLPPGNGAVFTYTPVSSQTL